MRVSNAGEKWSHCSPGRLIIDRTIAALHKEGVREFDFSVGDYDYKRRFGATQFALVDIGAALSWRGWPYACATAPCANYAAIPRSRRV